MAIYRNKRKQVDIQGVILDVSGDTAQLPLTLTVEEYFEEWWPYELPAEGFNKTAMLDFAFLYHRHKLSIMEPPIVKQRRKLLLEFINWRNDKDKTGLHIDAKEVDEFLKIKKKFIMKI